MFLKVSLEHSATFLGPFVTDFGFGHQNKLAGRFVDSFGCNDKDKLFVERGRRLPANSFRPASRFQIPPLVKQQFNCHCQLFMRNKLLFPIAKFILYLMRMYNKNDEL